MVRQVHVEQDRGRVEPEGELDALVRARGDDAAEAELVREIVEDARERHVVLDDEQDTRRVGNRAAVVIEGGGGPAPLRCRRGWSGDDGGQCRRGAGAGAAAATGSAGA